MNIEDIKPLITDDQGDWYSMKDISELSQRCPERIRQLTLIDNPIVIKDKSHGVILFRLTEGYIFSRNGGIKKR